VKVSYISDEKNARGGIALRNVAQRIKLLFGEEYGLQLYSTPGVGTEVVINLPKIIQT
jgi:two-component system sensor histidine kinase YesM